MRASRLIAATSLCVIACGLPTGQCAPAFEPSLGSAVVRAGQSSLVQITLTSSVALTQLTAGVSFPANTFTNFTLQRLASAVCTNWFEVVNPTNLSLHFSTCATNWLQGTQLLALLRFTAVTNQSSAFVSMAVGESVGSLTNGTFLEVESGRAGRITVIGNEPLLESRLASNGPTTTIFGTAGRDYRLEMSSNALDWNNFLTYAGGLTNLDEGAVYQRARYFRAQQLATSNNVTGDHLQTTNGDVVIHPLFHASFMMQWNGLAIYSDADDDSAFTARYVGLPRADLILVTHDHGDHFSSGQIDVIRRTNGAPTVLIVPQLVYNLLTTPQKLLATVLTNGASTNVLGMTIEAIPAYNDNHPRGNGNCYIVTIGGKRIFISGDTGATTEMRALQNIEVAFLCMNLPFTMSVTDAASALRAFRPRVVYPYHYRNSGGTFADLNALRQMVGTDLGIEVRVRRWY